MKCQNCQEPLEDSAAFCPECGTQRPANRTCIHCGSPVKVKQKFCSVCGKSPELTCQCGATLKPEQKFCKGCGKKVEQSSKKPVCPECGAAIEDQGPFCPDCGAAIANTSVTSTTGTSEPPEGEAGEVEKIRSDDNVEEPSVTETKITEPVSEGASTTHVCTEIRKATASDGDAEELTSEDDDDDDDDEEESETEDVEVKQPAEGGDDVEEQVPEDHDSKQLAAKTKDCEVKELTEGGDDVEEQVAEDLDSKQLAAKTKDGEVKEPTEGGDDVEGQVPEDLDSKQLVVKTKDGEVKKPTEGGDDVEEQVPEDLDSKQLAAKTEDGEVKESAANRADGKESTTREEGGEELLDKTGGSEAKEEDTGGTGVYGKVDGGADVTGVPEEKDKIMQDADGKKEAFVQSDTGETKPETPTAEVEPVSTNEETVDKATSETGHETNEDKEADSSTTSDEQTPASALRPGDTEQLRASENNTQAEDQRDDNLQKPPEDEESHGDTEVNGARQLATENDRDGQDDSPPGGTTEPSDKQPVPVQDEQPPIALPSEETPPENNQGVPSGPDSEVPGDTNLDQQKKKEEAAAVDNVEKTQQPATDGAGVAVQTQQAAEPVAKPPEPPEKTPIQETGGGASVQAGGTASETDDDQEIGAMGSSSNPNSKTDNTKGEDTTDDDVGDNDAFDDDGAGSSKSREGSQHRGRGEKGKARPKKPSAKERKRQRKREKKQQQQPAQAVQPSFTVSFHVVISKKFKHMEANNHRVYLSWKPDEKQQSPDDLIEMHPKGRSDGCGELYETTVEWSHLPKNPNKTCYKYCVEVDGKFEWEKLYRPKKDKKKDSVTAREPRIPTQTALQKGTWDVYDWVAYPSGMTGNLDTFFSWTGIATSARDIFYRDLAPACAMFLPSPDTIMDALCFHVDSKGQCAEDFLNTVKILRRTPPFNVSQEDVDKFIAECVETALLAPLLERVESILDREHRTVVVCVFLVLLAENTKSRLTQSNRQIVFRALLIKPDLEKKICPEIPQLSKHFPLLTRDKKMLVRKLQFLLNENKGDCQPSWIYCMPLLHLLSDDCREFQPPAVSEEHRTPRWWGVEKVAEKVGKFKDASQRSGWPQPVEEVLQGLSRAIQADQLMMRTFVATLTLRQLLDFLATQKLPAEIVIGSTFYQLNTYDYAHDYAVQLEMVDILRKTQTVIKTTITQNRHPSARDVDSWRLSAVVCVDLLQEVTETHRCHHYLIHAVVLLQMAILAALTSYTGRVTRSGGSPTNVIFDNTKLYLNKWLAGLREHVRWSDYKMMMEESIQAANSVTVEELRKQLKDILSDHAKGYISTFHPLEKLSACLQLLEDKSSLGDSLALDTYTVLEEALLDTELQTACSWFSTSVDQAYLLREKMSEMFKVKWNELYQQENGLLEIVFNWKPLMVYMNALHFHPLFRKYLTDDVAAMIGKAYDFLVKLLEKICNSRIRIGELIWISNHREQFCSVVHALFVESDIVKACDFLELREKEHVEYQRVNQDVNCALRMCQRIIQTDDMKESYQRFVNECKKDHRLSSMCSAASERTRVEDYIPEVHIKSVPDRFQRFLPDLAHRQNSAVFRDMLEKCARSMNRSPENKWWDVLVSVWSAAENEWKIACEAMKSGHITLDEAEKLFCVIQKNDKWLETCNSELESMARECGGSPRWVEERREQFQCLSQISRQRDAAMALCQIKEEFGFTGDVENIRIFQEVDMEQPIAKLNQSVVGTSKALEDIDRDSVVSFKQFGSDRCSKFVTWVRETMAGDGMKEVKVFVDMALNYVGDEPREMDKVRNLRDVVTGYAPLIFQSGSDATFLDRCSEVARNIRGDTALPDKLESTVDLVDWFDNIHKFHGSVEKTAMAQVDSITATGILKIGRLQEQLQKGKDLSFSDVICLEVPEKEEGKSQGKTYSYQDLVDLQSRLMLVVGQEEEGKSNVERFISVMDSVVRLVKTYIELCRSGCLLFLKWAAKFFFDTARGVCCIVEFFQGEETVTKLKGRQESHSLEQYMAKVADFLDRSLESWLLYVSEQRGHYEELNLFTMDQLVFLQEELAVIQYGVVSRHVYPLISLLLPRCPEDILQDAVEQASAMDSRPNTTDEGDEEEDKDAKEAAQFIQHMKANGFSQKLAVKALKDSVDPTDFDEGLTWCMSHADEDDDGADGKDAGDTDEKESLSSSQMEGTIASALQILDTLSGDLLSLEVLATHLNETWEVFLQRVKFSGEDFLSLPHLGNILKILADKGVCEYDRKLPPPLETDVPNLIVCPRRDVLKTVTSLYMFTKDAPLPQPDEVLLCTPNTTSEEVSMFLRRAFSEPSTQQGKIHCLAFADSLDYEVGERAEKDLKEFIYTTRHPYQLVVVCTSENEFNAQMTASLEKYGQSPPIAAADEAKMLEYLHCKFTVPEDVGPNESAACFDPDRLCVRVVRSARSGMGKTLYKNRLVSQLKNLATDDDDEDKNVESDEDVEDDDFDESDISEENSAGKVHVTVPLYQKQVESHEVAATLLQRLPPSRSSLARLIHLDVAYEVQEGVDQLLYNLLVLGCITDVHGYVWRRSSSDLYLVEAMPLLEHTESQEDRLMHQMFSILPSVKCCSPEESLATLEKKQDKAVKGEHVLLFDSEEYRSTTFQRPFHYLSAHNTRGGPQPFQEQGLGMPVLGNESSCLRTLIKHCGVKNPSWSELNHFVSFLNKQLEDFEHSIFCSSDLSQDLPGFPAFVLRFLIHMSRDFATRSIKMAEESLPVLSRHDADDDIDNRDGIEQYQMRRTWESSPHPYTFFNPDRTSMTFLGFTVDPHSGSMMDQSGRVLEGHIMTRHLYHSLVANGAPISEDFDRLPRQEKLQRLYKVMGVPFSDEYLDPDNTYELTTDNAKKILAIYMRFRCNIPVIVMGETGCGKTRLVQFMCALQNPKAKSNKTMVIMKVHGGTTAEDIYKKVREAEAMAKQMKECGEEKDPDGSPRPIYTVLFFDEANTTEAIGAIKEVMCDGAMNGKPIKLHENLKMVAACNPYRKHSKQVIERLEKAGLGYHVSAEKTCDKLGRVPMRQLVYRVQPLPQSMLPLVWDFGQLNIKTESIYIKQMVLRYVREGRLENPSKEQYETLCKILVQSQAFMRNLEDECSFVSLRDADRALMVTSWFLQQKQLLDKIGRSLRGAWRRVNDMTIALVLALAVCYRAGLPSKNKFEQHVYPSFNPHFALPQGAVDFDHIIDSCQEILLENVKLGEKIARNQALKENVFMMVVCVELRIPLFLVGKPGSSKSLAKAIVADAMQGAQAKGDLFKTLKEAQMVSFQCSPLATADGILGTFRQCAKIQHGKDRDKFVAVAVLDEIGLAEDSPKMPLKALHPLLEDGYEIDEEKGEDSEEHRDEEGEEDEDEEDEDEEEEEEEVEGLADSAKPPNLYFPVDDISDPEVEEEDALSWEDTVVPDIGPWAHTEEDSDDSDAIAPVRLAGQPFSFLGESLLDQPPVEYPALPLNRGEVFNLAGTVPSFLGESQLEQPHEQQQTGSRVHSRSSRTEKVAFIGISNWALDPAKMNRGILVQRDVPDENELVETAKSICDSGEEGILKHVHSLVKKLAVAYLGVFGNAAERREFFGLRDFYSLVKMVHAIATREKRKLTRDEFKVAVLRNFGGLKEVDPVRTFDSHLTLDDTYEGSVKEKLDSSYAGLLQMALQGDGWSGESRYLLLLTENYGGLHILTDNLLAKQSVVPIFGSSFPRDQEYTQICRNINRIKVCMETGKTVILLNLDNLYESLYDALNQYYSYLAKARYVDLGLGTHRVKCKVDTDFRLIVVAEKETVYNKFPIPLINRLEKHFLTVNNLLNDAQHRLQSQLIEWVDGFLSQGTGGSRLTASDVFIGYHLDTAASIILRAWDMYISQGHTLTRDTESKILEECQKALLWCATPDAVVRCQDEWGSDAYFSQQQHDSLAQYLQAVLQATGDGECLMTQVTTHAKLLTDTERLALEEKLPGFNFKLLSLQAFHTEQQFRHQLSLFLGEDGRLQKVLVVQCDQGNVNQNLLQCSQYCVQSTWSSRVRGRHVVFIVQLPRVTSKAFSGFMGGRWHCAHVDDLRSPSVAFPTVAQLQTCRPSELLASAIPTGLKQETRPTDKNELAEHATKVSLDPGLARHLLASCIQGAVARIRDGSGANGRSTDRIALLLQCLEKRDDSQFLSGILRMVSEVLQQKEAASPDPGDPYRWLSKDAANPDWVKKCGTMRRAWMQYLERLIVPILAGVVAYLDTNHNLDLLQEDSWVLELWLNILNDPELCQLQFSDLLSMSGQQTQLKEFVCRSTFLVQDSASAALPFSWVIAEEIDTFLTKTPASGSDYSAEEAAVEACEKSPMSRHLRHIVTSDEIAAELVQRYMADLLHAHFRLSPQQHELLMQCMNAALEQDNINIRERYRLCRVLVKVHTVLAVVQPRLQAVLDMAACHPQAIQVLQEKRCGLRESGSCLEPELVEDVLLLEILSQEMTPEKSQLNKEEECQQWLDLHNKISPVLSRVLEDAENHLVAGDPQYEGDGTEQRKTWLAYGPWCREHLIVIQCQWTRITIVKLFIDYMSPLLEGTGLVQVGPINYNLLWNCLSTANLKTQQTLDKLDKYLKHANSQMVKSLLGDVGSCKHCNTKLEGPPIELPCGHRICSKCYTLEAMLSRKCPECHLDLPRDFNDETSGFSDRAAVEKLLCYQRQTSAFLMAVVSQLCFAGHQAPEPEAVQHIFSYVIRRVEGVATVQTQQLTLRDDQMDPSPVLRSFILRLLLKYSETQASEQIRQFLEHATNLVEEHVADKTQQSVLTELSLLVIHCIESLEYEAEASTDEGTSCFENQCLRVKDQLNRIRIKLESSPLELSTLIAVGQLRHALSSCASLLYKHVVEPADFQGINMVLKDLLMEASVVCTMGPTDWPRNFLVKQLCRDFGVQSYNILLQRAQAQRCLQWIKLENVQQSEEVTDRYLVCGPEYRSVRDEVMQEMRGQKGELIMRLSELRCSSETKQYLLRLALHREVQMAFLSSPERTKAATKEKAVALVQSRRIHVDESFALRVVNNTLGIPQSALCVKEGQGMAEQSMVCVLTHLWVALQTQSHHRDLLAPLAALIDHPEQMQNSFLPTMPQDNVDEILRALEIDHSKTMDDYNAGHEIPKLWQCANGHRYVIGDCGNPNARGRCPECQIDIGGARYHVAAEGNLLARVADQTQPGHTLGAVESRSLEALPERGMSAAACAVLRFLTHATLYISAGQLGQLSEVCQLVRPAISDAEVIPFFWGHLHKDLQVLQRVLGRSCDDVYLLLHHLCHQLTKLSTVHYWTPKLKSKKEREEWERKFTEHYIQPLFQQTEEVIKNGNDLLVSDTRQGQNQLLNVVFEVSEQDEQSDEDLQHTAAPWKYRTRITVDHFFRKFELHVHGNQADSDRLPVLTLFHKESHHLRALHYVPDILALQRHLLQQLRHRLSRVDVSKTTVRDLLDKTAENPELLKLLEVFSQAWDIVKDYLFSHRCQTAEGKIVHLPEEYHTVRIGEKSPVGVLLPDTEGPGRCAYLLIHYLLVQHNDFLQRYCPHTRHTFDQLPEVPVHMITRRHLVSYSPQTDLLPLVLAHCNSSLHLGHGDGDSATRLDYDFQGFELQLRNTLLLGKSRALRGQRGDMEIETMSYCADITSSKLINRLGEKISQEALEVRLQRQITSEFQENLTDICQAIDSVNTTLTFLLTLKVTADQSLHAFMVETLRMKDNEGLRHSRKAQQYCCLKHVQSLWLLLCFLRARILATHNEEAFDEQGRELRKDLSQRQVDEVNLTLRRLTPEHVELVLTQIYQCIVLRLTGHSQDEDYASPDNYSLRWLLTDSVENSVYSIPGEDRQQDQLAPAELESFPESVLASQAIPVWTHVLTHLTERQQ